MKTYNEIKTLNYQDLAFITGKSAEDCKWAIAIEIFGDINKIPLSKKTRIPKIGVSDQVEKERFDFTMKSNSPQYDGKCRLKQLVEYYNKGCDIDTLRRYGENTTFIKAMKFTGKYSILNEIMNDEQLLKLQRIWLFANVYGKKERFGKNVDNFLNKNQWAKELVENRKSTASL